MKEMATVQVIAAFDGMRLGDVVQVESTPRIKGIIACGLLKDVTPDGSGTGGQDSNPESSEARSERGDLSGDAPDEQPGTGFGASGYGQAQGIDPQ